MKSHRSCAGHCPNAITATFVAGFAGHAAINLSTLVEVNPFGTDQSKIGHPATDEFRTALSPQLSFDFKSNILLKGFFFYLNADGSFWKFVQK